MRMVKTVAEIASYIFLGYAGIQIFKEGFKKVKVNKYKGE